MRFDTPVYFQKVAEWYDPASGNYTEEITAVAKRYASVSDSGINTLRLIYGEIRQGSKTVRLQNAYDEPFDRIKIGEKLYTVDFSRKYRTKHVFVVSEVQ